MNLINAVDINNLAVFTLMRIVSWLPFSQAKNYLVRGIALIGYRLSKKNREIKARLIAIILGGKLSKSEQQALLKETFHMFWQERFSVLLTRRERAMLGRLDVQGLEHLHKALGAGRGVILWESAVFGGRFVTKQILYERGFAVHQVHAMTHLSRSNTWVGRHVVQKLFENGTGRYIAEIIYLPDSNSLAFTRTLLNRLQENAILAVSADGKHGQNFVTLDFLGFSDTFSTGMISLAKLSGATILPIFCVTKENGNARLIIESPIQIRTDIERERTLEDSVSQFVRLLEAYIRKYPQEYRGWRYLDKLMSQEIVGDFVTMP